MMRAMAFALNPPASTNLNATKQNNPLRVHLTWRRGAAAANTGIETDYTVQRRVSGTTAWATVAVTPAVAGTSQSYDDTTVVAGTGYQHQVIASNIVGDRTDYTPGNANAVGYPTLSANSTAAGPASIAV